MELSDAAILMELWQVITYYRTRLNLSDESWQVSTFRLNVPAGSVRIGNISASDFGSAFLIRSENTENNPYFIGRTVDIVRLTDMAKYYSGPENTPYVGNWWGPHVATAMAPYQDGGQWKMMWSHPHSEAAAYTVYYTPGPANVPPVFADNTQFPLENQNWYIIADVAYNLMPYLADAKTGLNPKQQALMGMLEKKLKQYEPVFHSQVTDGPRRESTVKRRIFGGSRG